ncbi:MAG TPA: TolC family protein, partial [bacterium]
RAEEANLRRLLGLDPSCDFDNFILPSVSVAEFELEPIYDRVIEYRHELALAGVSVEEAELNVDLARAQDDPDFSLGFMYNFIGQSMMGEALTSGDDAWGFMFGVTLPVWGGKNEARIDSAEAGLDAARSDFENAENQAYYDVEKIYWQSKNQGRLVVLYRDTLVPDAVNSAELAQTWYENGEINFMTLIETRLVVQNFSLALARAEADYLKTLADLHKLTGIEIFGPGGEEQ